MQPRRSPIYLPPALAAAMLAAFALTGMLLGLLTHGLVISATAATARVTQTPTRPHATAVREKSPTATPHSATGRFDLVLSVSPQRVSPGDTITVTVKATVAGTSTPLASLLCALGGGASGPALLAQWPAARATNAAGIATWQITVPQVAPNTYSIEVKASTTSPVYSAYRIALVFVTA